MRGIVGMGVGAALLAAGVVIGGIGWHGEESAVVPQAPAAVQAPAAPRVEYTGGDRGLDFSLSEKPELAARNPAWLWHEMGVSVCNGYKQEGMAGVERYATQYAGPQDAAWFWVRSMAAYCPEHWNDR